LVIAAILVFGVACSHDRRKEFERIRLGMSRDEVEHITGKPHQISISEAGEHREYWSYPTADPFSSLVPMCVFNKDGKVIAVYLDERRVIRQTEHSGRNGAGHAP
jgi:hypothetical protein